VRSHRRAARLLQQAPNARGKASVSAAGSGTQKALRAIPPRSGWVMAAFDGQGGATTRGSQRPPPATRALRKQPAATPRRARRWRRGDGAGRAGVVDSYRGVAATAVLTIRPSAIMTFVTCLLPW